jgi:hypothetical protein
MKLLEKWIESVRAVRDRLQDIGDETLRSPATSQPEFGLTTEQMRDIQLALVENSQPIGKWPRSGKSSANEAAICASRPAASRRNRCDPNRR